MELVLIELIPGNYIVNHPFIIKADPGTMAKTIEEHVAT